MPFSNPFKGMPKWGIYATVAGGVLIFGYAEYKHHEDTGSWSPFTSSSTSTSTTSTETDPVTGLPYSEDDTVDPITGLEYLAEAEEYGSVSAAEADVSDFGATESTGSGVPVSAGAVESDQASADTTVGGDVYTSNSAWSQAVQAGLEDISGSTTYDGADIGTALGLYLTGQPLTSAEANVINVAIAEYGNPPVGTFQVILAPTATASTSTTSATATSSSTAGEIKVPNVVGRTDLDTAKSIITAAGLKATASGDSGAGNTGSVTSQSPAAGTYVAKGSSVNLVYTSDKADNPQVAVPNEVGRTDLDTAETDIKNAGLTVAVTGNTALAKGNKGKVTAQSPKAGTKVAKGTKVTLTYS